MKQFNEIFMKIVFMISACASILAILLICLFLFFNGIPAMSEIGFGKFLLGTSWKDVYKRQALRCPTAISATVSCRIRRLT